MYGRGQRERKQVQTFTVSQARQTGHRSGGAADSWLGLPVVVNALRMVLLLNLALLLRLPSQLAMQAGAGAV